VKANAKSCGLATIAPHDLRRYAAWRIMPSHPSNPLWFVGFLTIAQITLGVKPSPEILPALLMDRSNGPAFIPAPKLQVSTDCFTHPGTGMVRIMAAFSSQVRDHPTAFPKLEILET
jgi:hypothetical protein